MLARCLFVASLLIVVVLPLRAADAPPAPTMTVSMTIAGQAVDPALAPRIGVDLPVAITWTLANAPDTARWETCRLPLRTPGIVIDAISPPPSSLSPLQWPAETRSVTLHLHGDGTVANFTQTEVALCYARLADQTTPYAAATMRVQPIYPYAAHLPQVDQIPFAPPAYPAP